MLVNSCTVVNPSQDAFISMVCKTQKDQEASGRYWMRVAEGDQMIPELAEVNAVGVTQIDRIVEVV